MEHAFSPWQDEDEETHYLLWSASLSLVYPQGYDEKKNAKSANFLRNVQSHQEYLLSSSTAVYPVCLYRLYYSTTTPCPSVSEKKDKTPPVRSEISPRTRRCPLRRAPKNISYGNAYKMDGIARNGYTALSKD
jgi:hypothetical protein